MTPPRRIGPRRPLVAAAFGAIAVASLGIFMPARAIESLSRDDQLTGLIASPIASPHPVVGTDGMRHLVYELQLTNVTQSRIVVQGVDTVARGQVLTHLGHAAVAAQMTPFGTGQPGAVLRPGGSGSLLLDTALPRSAEVPRRLVHDFTISYNPATELPTQERTGTTQVTRSRPAIVNAPLRGARWVDVNGCCGPGGHRSAVNPINGKLYVAERFAIDFVQLTRDKTLVDGDPDQLTSWPSYGDRVVS